VIHYVLVCTVGKKALSTVILFSSYHLLFPWFRILPFNKEKDTFLLLPGEY